jgi:hypothetical protein
MWRVVRANGSLSDMVNKARAKDAAWGIAERRVFVGGTVAMWPKNEPAKKGHFFKASRPYVRLFGGALA